MTRRAALCALALVVGGSSSERHVTDERPNIVIVLADDLGFSDIGCYGSEIATPNLDRLAADGLRFTQFYSAARCCPSRAALLTGRYPHQVGVGHMTTDFGTRAYRGFLDDRCVTIAEALRDAGYATSMTGKWHVGSDTHKWPLDRGFQRYFGTPNGGGIYFRNTPRTDDIVFVNGETVVELPASFYATDAFTTYALRFVEKAVADGKPFFLYLAQFAPHWPLQAKRKDIEKYKGRYRRGWDAIRAARYERQLELGLIRPEWKLSVRDPEAGAWATQPKAVKRDLAERMSVYAAQVDSLDQNVGRLVNKLAELEVLENTLLVFLSDNGCAAVGGVNGLDKSPKVSTTPGAAGYVKSAGLGWANASDAPFRRFKKDTYEGGIATPFIVHWPAGLERNGELEPGIGHVIDLMPTILDVAGVPYPDDRNGAKTAPLEGRSLVPFFRGESLPTRALFWEHEGNRAVRRGRWKLVASNGEAWSLFDMERDRTEQHDMASDHPVEFAELRALWTTWAKEVGVEPWPAIRSKWQQRTKARADSSK